MADYCGGKLFYSGVNRPKRANVYTCKKCYKETERAWENPNPIGTCKKEVK